jgi:type I restriction enzyme, R subunit
MSVHLELAFEEEVCEVLGSHGWLYADKTADNYDRKLALYPPDLTAWLEESQKELWRPTSRRTAARPRPTCCNASASSSTSKAPSTCCGTALR